MDGVDSRGSYRHFVIVFLPLMEHTIMSIGSRTPQTVHRISKHLYSIPHSNLFIVLFVPFASFVSVFLIPEWTAAIARQPDP